jgi:HEAT repeat protein
MTTPNPSAEAHLRRRAVVIAGHRGDPSVARDHLDDPDPAVRASALAALARTGDLTAAEIARGVTDPDPTVRRRSAELAASGAVPAPLVDLMPLLDDPDARVVEAAAWATGELSPPPPQAVDRLCRLVTDHDDALVREAAVAALGAIGDERALPTILGATTDKATVRRRAVIALAPFDGPDVDDALERARTDRDWQVRQAAEDLLAPVRDDEE